MQVSYIFGSFKLKSYSTSRRKKVFAFFTLGFRKKGDVKTERKKKAI